MKDAAKLVLYFVVVVLIGAALAPPLYWAGQAAIGTFPSLGRVGFESFFHRALLIAAIALLWPLLRWCRVRRMQDVDLAPDDKWRRHLTGGFVLAAIPLLCCGLVVILLHVYSIRDKIELAKIPAVAAAAVFAPAIEEPFFRGLVLGLLLRGGRRYFAIFLTSALFSLLHFLKAPEQTAAVVGWTSGFASVAESLNQFRDPMMVLAAFTTLFLLGWILADVRCRTRSLWLPIGLHSGWILAAGIFNRAAHRDQLALPWLGKSLLVGVVPLVVALLTWLLVVMWLKRDARPAG